MKLVVVGTGYVGLVSGVCIADVGHDVVCIDRDASRLSNLGRGAAPFFEPGLDDLLAGVVASGRLRAEEDLTRAMIGADVVMIAVGTPSTEAGIDLTYVREAAGEIGSLLARTGRKTTVVVKSTVVPGTTVEQVTPILLRASGLDRSAFGVAMNPEFLREGSAVADFHNPDRIVLGCADEVAVETLQQLYAPYTCPKLVTDPTTAELIKYAANCLLATMISYANEFAGLCESHDDVDPELLFEGLCLDRRITSMTDHGPVRAGIAAYLRPGSGFGGSCFPKDLHALRHHMASRKIGRRLLDAAHEVNQERPDLLVDRLEKVLGGLKGRRVALLGLSFKPDSDDLRMSPAIALAERLMRRGADVVAHDPMVPPHTVHPLLPQGIVVVDTPAAAYTEADATVLATAWPEYLDLDWGAVLERMARPVLCDARSALNRKTLPASAQVVRIGTNRGAGNA